MSTIKFGARLEDGSYNIPKDYKPKTRKDAQKAGDILYYEKDCENKHKSPRYTRDNVCKECYRLKRKAAILKRMKKLADKEKVEVKKAAFTTA